MTLTRTDIVLTRKRRIPIRRYPTLRQPPIPPACALKERVAQRYGKAHRASAQRKSEDSQLSFNFVKRGLSEILDGEQFTLTAHG